MAPSRRVNTPAPSTLVRAVVLVLAAAPSGWAAARLIRRETAGTGALRTGVTSVVLAVAFAWAAIRGPPAWPLLVASVVLAWSLVCLAAIDLAVHRLPDALTLPLLAMGLGVTLLLPDRPLADHVAGAIAGWGALDGGRLERSVVGGTWKVRHGRGRCQAFRRGRGLAGVARPLPSVMLIACAAAFLWVGGRTIRRGGAAARERIAFGGPLCLAILAVWLEGPLAI